jgi:thioredoxin-like negative regulator of GroEL
MELEAGGKKAISGLTYFGAKWCGFCNEFNPTWSKLNKLLKGLPINATKVDVDKHKKLLKKYKIDSFPSVIYIKKDGKGMYRFNKKRTISNLLKFCKECKQRDK